MQDQWDLGAGEDSVVSFQEAVKGHAKKAGVCRGPEEQRAHLKNRIRLVSPEDHALERVELKLLPSELVTSGMPQHSPLPWVRKN